MYLLDEYVSNIMLLSKVSIKFNCKPLIGKERLMYINSVESIDIRASTIYLMPTNINWFSVHP